MKTKIFFSTLTFFLLAAASITLAGPSGPPPSAVPIDGGLGIVLAGCVGYGAKKIYSRIKK